MADDNKPVPTITTYITDEEAKEINTMIVFSKDNENEQDVEYIKLRNKRRQVFEVLAEMPLNEMTPLQHQVLQSICNEFPEFVEESISSMMKDIKEFVAKTKMKEKWEDLVVKGVNSVA